MPVLPFSVRMHIVAVGVLSTLAGVVGAQPQANVQIPFRAANDGFFEQFGTGWAFSGPNWFARFGGAPAVPPFGGVQPGAGITGGVGFNGGGINGGLGFMAAQGSRRGNVTQSGNLTLFNGYPGFLSDTSQSPFVVGLIPIVGQGKAPWRLQYEGDIPTQRRDPPATPALAPAAEARQTTPPPAGRPHKDRDPGQFSLQEIQRQRAEEEARGQQEARAHLAKAREARAAGKQNVARIYYQMAARRAVGPWKDLVQAELNSLDADRPAAIPAIDR